MVLYFGSFCKHESLLCFYILYWKLLSKIPLILFLFHLLSRSLRLGKLVLQMLHTAPESCFQLLKHETPSNFAQVFSSCTFPPTICMHVSTLSCISSICLVPFATLIAFIIFKTNIPMCHHKWFFLIWIDVTEYFQNPKFQNRAIRGF